MNRGTWLELLCCLRGFLVLAVDLIPVRASMPREKLCDRLSLSWAVTVPLFLMPFGSKKLG
jgi:hypothetical protein